MCFYRIYATRANKRLKFLLLEEKEKVKLFYCMKESAFLIKGKSFKNEALISIVHPPMGNPPLRYIEMSILSLKEGEEYEISTTGKECLFLLLRGKAKVVVHRQTFLAERENLFKEKAYGIYIPPHTDFSVSAKKDSEFVFCFAPSEKKGKVVFIKPEDVKVRRVGEGNFYREVHDILAEDIPADKLLVGETFNPPGNWSSYPPHRHDEHNPPEKIRLEEVYHFRLHPENGFAMMRLYDDELTINEALVVENKDTVIISKGYHPVVSAPGYWLYYLWILAGEERKLIPINDPKHEWVIKKC